MTASRIARRLAAISRYSRCSLVSRVSRASSVMPMMPFIGVRISWLMWPGTRSSPCWPSPPPPWPSRDRRWPVPAQPSPRHQHPHPGRAVEQGGEGSGGEEGHEKPDGQHEDRAPACVLAQVARRWAEAEQPIEVFRDLDRLVAAVVRARELRPVCGSVHDLAPVPRVLEQEDDALVLEQAERFFHQARHPQRDGRKAIEGHPSIFLLDGRRFVFVDGSENLAVDLLPAHPEGGRGPSP